MTQYFKVAFLLPFALAISFILGGCANTSQVAANAAIGAGVGAGVGFVAAGPKGAAVGGVAGALIGALETATGNAPIPVPPGTELRCRYYESTYSTGNPNAIFYSAIVGQTYRTRSENCDADYRRPFIP